MPIQPPKSGAAKSAAFEHMALLAPVGVASPGGRKAYGIPRQSERAVITEYTR